MKGTSLQVVGGPNGWMEERCDWYWRVRAVRDGEPLPWSEARPFDVVRRKN